jgi:hypothetical protein
VVGDFARGPIGEFSEIPEEVLKMAPPLAQRFQDLIALLADGTRELELVRVEGWFLWRRERRWFWGRREMPVHYGSPDNVRLITDDFALELIEETLVARPEVEPIVAEPARVERANAAIDKAFAALQRLYGGEVWEESLDTTGLLTAEERSRQADDDVLVPDRLRSAWPDAHCLRFARALKLYRGYKRARGPLHSVEKVSEEWLLGDLIHCSVQRSGPVIVPERPDHQLPTMSEEPKG